MRGGGLPPHFHMVPRRAGVALRGEAWDGASLPHLGHYGMPVCISKHWVGKVSRSKLVPVKSSAGFRQCPERSERHE